MTINHQIKNKKIHYDINSEAAKNIGPVIRQN